MGQLTLFDYSGMDPETRIVVQQRTSEIKGLMRRAAQDIVDIGLKLIEVKERLGHGGFGAWLEAEFGWHHNTAINFMRVADRFGEQSHKICDFAPSALYLLSAPSTPDAAREEALELAASGQPVTHTKAKEIVQAHTPAPVPPSRPVEPDQDEEDEDETEEYAPPPLRPLPQPAAASPAPLPPPLLPAPAPVTPKPVPRFPHSDRLISWLQRVSGEMHYIDIELGGIRKLLNDRDGWNWRDVACFVLPTLEDLNEAIRRYQEEIERAKNDQG